MKCESEFLRGVGGRAIFAASATHLSFVPPLARQLRKWTLVVASSEILKTGELQSSNPENGLDGEGVSAVPIG